MEHLKFRIAYTRFLQLDIVHPELTFVIVDHF